MRGEWQALFHTPQALDRFRRIVATAIASNPELLAVERRSLWRAATHAAQDGLLPDGREGAIVIYKVKRKIGNTDQWVPEAKWMPMVAGIIKKIRSACPLDFINVQVVREQDHFDYEQGDSPRIVHRPAIGDRGKAVGAYAILRIKGDEAVREVMSLQEIEHVRSVSKAKDVGPWKEWWDEMARKTVLRRASKYLPTGNDVALTFSRDDDLYDLQRSGAPQLATPTKRPAQLKRDGEWEAIRSEIAACGTSVDLNDWWEQNEARIGSLPDMWQDSVSDLFTATMDKLLTAEEQSGETGDVVLDVLDRMNAEQAQDV